MLHIAAENNIIRLAFNCIVTFNADLYIEDNKGNKPIDLATDQNSDIANLLKKSMQNTQSTRTQKQVSTASSVKNNDKTTQIFDDFVRVTNPKNKMYYLGVNPGFLTNKKKAKNQIKDNSYKKSI